MENRIYKFSYLFIIICFSSIFLISLFKVVNGWSFSQANLNYFGGFVKRGLFGTLMYFFENNLKVSREIFFSSFFIIITSLNIYLFFRIIKIFKYKYLLFIYLAFNPALLLFSFNDLGGYQRFDSISIFLILLHIIMIQKIHNQKISISYYKKFLNILYFLIFLSILIHEIQIFSLPFHMIISMQVLKKKINKLVYFYCYSLLIIFGILITIFFNADSEMMNSVLQYIGDVNIYDDAINFAAGTNSINNGFEPYFYELKTNLFNDYNVRINLFFILATLMPIFSSIYYLKYINSISKILIKNHYFYLISIIPFFSMFFIGDTGRWISLMGFVAFGILMVNKFDIKKIKKIDESNILTKIILFILIIFYCFFTRVPHCCNLEKNNINIFGGMINKFVVFGNIIINNNSDEFNLNKRFPM